MPFGVPTISDAVDINDKGIAVGWSAGQFGPGPIAVLWIDGVGSPLPGLRAIAINNRGAVVIQAGADAVLWTPDFEGAPTGQATTIGAFTPHAINDRGEVVGQNANNHAVVWRPDAPGATDGVLTDLGTLGGASSVALDINRHGEIVGYSTTNLGETHAFVWRPGDPRGLSGTMVDLTPLLGAGTAIASAINDQGEIAGLGSFPQHPFATIWVWCPSPKPGAPGTVTILGSTALPDVAIARAGPDINRRGDVVYGLNGHATLWRR
jgi:probable HAF family extracellular repeat protein